MHSRSHLIVCLDALQARAEEVYTKLANLAVFLSEPATLVEREPEFLFNRVWQFAQDFDRAYMHVVKCAGGEK